MPRSNRIFKRFNKQRSQSLVNNRHVKGNNLSGVDFLRVDNDSSSPGSSRSRQKIGNRTFSDCEETTEKSGFRIIDLELLGGALLQACVCRHCGASNLEILDDGKRVGVACNLHIVCKTCDADTEFKTSKKYKRYYESNLRLSYGLRCVGVGREGGNLLCGILNMPPPCYRFTEMNNELLTAVYDVFEQSLSSAVAEAVCENDPLDQDETNHVRTDLIVSCDGTFMKRGHTSLYGVTSVISVDTGKVLDAQVVSKYCQVCSTREVDNAKAKNHNCSINYCGSSGGMEGVGLKMIFGRSLDKHGVRYVKYLGDGDSSAFKVVCESMPYGEECQIEKLECIGHIQKRMGSRLRKLVSNMKGKKLEDGKCISGHNRLTKRLIDSLQVYYGRNIRENLSSVEDMRKAVWATYFHMMSTDEKPIHQLCPISWCKYKQAQRDNNSYTHKKCIPECVMNAIKPTFRFLANPDLLRKCVHGKTQNPNESLNALIWKRCPKTTFASSTVVRLATYDAVIVFNNGNIGRVKVIQRLGFRAGAFTLTILKAIDSRRVARAEMSIEDLAKETRQRKRSHRASLEDKEDPEYSPGAF